MMCQLCGKRPANVCINIDINGNKSQRFICDKCADERKIKENPSGAAILALVNDIRAANLSRQQSEGEKSEQIERTCKSCGMTYKEFAKTYMLGCEDCYESFEDIIKPLVESITKPSAVSAQSEKPQNDDVPDRNQILKLKLLLKQCIEREDYENAAKFRDKIAELEAVRHEVKTDG